MREGWSLGSGGTTVPHSHTQEPELHTTPTDRKLRRDRIGPQAPNICQAWPTALPCLLGMVRQRGWECVVILQVATHCPPEPVPVRTREEEVGFKVVRFCGSTVNFWLPSPCSPSISIVCRPSFSMPTPTPNAWHSAQEQTSKLKA